MTRLDYQKLPAAERIADDYLTKYPERDREAFLDGWKAAASRSCEDAAEIRCPKCNALVGIDGLYLKGTFLNSTTCEWGCRPCFAPEWEGKR